MKKLLVEDQGIQKKGDVPGHPLPKEILAASQLIQLENCLGSSTPKILGRQRERKSCPLVLSPPTPSLDTSGSGSTSKPKAHSREGSHVQLLWTKAGQRAGPLESHMVAPEETGSIRASKEEQRGRAKAPTCWDKGRLLQLHVGKGLLVVKNAWAEDCGGTVVFFKCWPLW